MPEPTLPAQESRASSAIRLLMLRHAHVDFHRGDVPITSRGRQQAHQAGRWIGRRGDKVSSVLFGGTRRTRETAEELLIGLGSEQPHHPGTVDDAFALRNPDLYLGGTRVTMVSTAENFAEQAPQVQPAEVCDVRFYREWLTHPERVGYWLHHPAPPGDSASTVYARVIAFAQSLSDVPRWQGQTILAITHSPVLRTIGLHLRGADPGEPGYVHGYEFTVADGNVVDLTELEPLTEPAAHTP